MRMSAWSSDVCPSELNGRCTRTGLAAALLLSAAPLWAADSTRVGIGVDYSRGDYGGTLETSIVSVPLSLQVRRGRWQFDANLPWLRVSGDRNVRSEEHTSELKSLMRISYADFCLKKKKQKTRDHHN